MDKKQLIISGRKLGALSGLLISIGYVLYNLLEPSEIGPDNWFEIILLLSCLFGSFCVIYCSVLAFLGGLFVKSIIKDNKKNFDNISTFFIVILIGIIGFFMQDQSYIFTKFNLQKFYISLLYSVIFIVDFLLFQIPIFIKIARWKKLT
jgi:hypothetical protein